MLEQALDEGERQAPGGAETLEAVREIDAWARELTPGLISRVESEIRL